MAAGPTVYVARMAPTCSGPDWSRCASPRSLPLVAAVGLRPVVRRLVPDLGVLRRLGPGGLSRLAKVGGEVFAPGGEPVAYMFGYVRGFVSHRACVLGGDGCQLGGLGGHIAEQGSRLPSSLVDHVLKLAEPSLGRLAGACGLFAAVWSSGAGSAFLAHLIVRSHDAPRSSATTSCPSTSGTDIVPRRSSGSSRQPDGQRSRTSRTAQATNDTLRNDRKRWCRSPIRVGSAASVRLLSGVLCRVRFGRWSGLVEQPGLQSLDRLSRRLANEDCLVTRRIHHCT